jgi:DNA polymerase III subunit epsilon
MNFVAIDFETATYHNYSACAVGIVTVRNNEIIDEYYTLIQPPENKYFWQNIRIHKIKPRETADLPNFYDLFPEIIKRLDGQSIVAHNESFDRKVMKGSMEYYGLRYDDYNMGITWECTCKIYKKKGYKPAKLSSCCERQGIELNHHHALSDALGCAHLYLMS